MAWVSRRLGIAVLGSFLLLPGAALLADDGLTIGAARLDITPDLRLTNWVTRKAYSELLDPVSVRALVLGQGDRRIALLSWELPYPMEGVVARTRAEITRATGIKESDILICTTHNHSAPWSPVIDDPLTKAEQKVLEPFLQDPLYSAWASNLLTQTLQAVKQADAGRKPATLSLGRAYVGDVVFNRRPVRPDGNVESMAVPKDPHVLPRALRFGPMDPTLTLLVARDEEQRVIASLYHMPCHAVAIYPEYNGISADWPGAASAGLEKELGGHAIFLQGCAGDIVPVRRGEDGRAHVAATVVERGTRTAKTAQPLSLTNTIQVAQVIVKAPVEEAIRSELGRDFLSVEVQVISCGPLALVALPGEPLIALSQAIQERSPFPHTIVVGYANGYGTQYVGLPGEKARGGYEMGGRNLGTDACGRMLVDAAVALLQKQAAAR